MSFIHQSSPHTYGRSQVDRVMLSVILACIPGLLALSYLFGWGTLINLVIASITALAAEAAMLRLRQRALVPALKDLSALVTALLLAIALPPTLPWWMVVLGSGTAIIVAKHLYGGLGNNPFNPAMVGYVLLLICFPIEMTGWLAPQSLATPPSFSESLHISAYGRTSEGADIDAMSAATPLDGLKTALSNGEVISEATQANAYLQWQYAGWPWVALAFLIGGLVLWRQKIFTLHAPLGLLLGLGGISLIFFLVDPSRYPSPLFHLLNGGAIFAAFFIVTDPVSGATSNRGRLLFGLGVGLLIYIIRTWGGYPDAIAFAVLLMNICAPTIDHYSKPTSYGHGGKP